MSKKIEPYSSSEERNPTIDYSVSPDYSLQRLFFDEQSCLLEWASYHDFTLLQCDYSLGYDYDPESWIKIPIAGSSTQTW